MWCKHCRQDVPGAAAPDQPPVGNARAGGSRCLLCVRCGEPIGSEPLPPALDTVAAELGTELAAIATESAPAAAKAAEFEAWQWELDQDLHDVRRLIERQRANGSGELNLPSLTDRPATSKQDWPASTVPANRIDAPVLPSWAEPRRRAASPVAWLMLMLGLTATVCGGVLLGWSMMADRTELWNLGVPITLGGQAVLFLSLMLILSRRGRQSDELDRRSHPFDRQQAGSQDPAATSAFGGAPHQSFYTHLAEGAQPQLLLADLKNQLDLLAIRMARPER